MNKIKILITSIGSLVGQNLIEALDFSILPRRHLVYLIGTNSLIDSQNNFKCDKFYNVPNTSSKEFIDKMKVIIKNEEPDIILCGRDKDTEIVAKLMNDTPELKGNMPYGSIKSLMFGLNKWKTWLFTQKYNLPFANTFILNNYGDISTLGRFVKKYGYPLIAKPIEGFASKGVFFVRNWAQAEFFANKENYLLQEYIGQPNDMVEFFNKMDGPTPLFANAPNNYHYTCQTIINPDGKINKFFITKNLHVNGATISLTRVKNPELENIAILYAKGYINEGGYGPFGVQFRQDKNGKWKGQEMNLRTNGNTYPRLLMGQDDIGLIVNSILPHLDFPIFKETESSYDLIITKTLSCNILKHSKIKKLKDKEIWKKQYISC